MSTHFKSGPHFENHRRAAELHDLAAHAHRSGEQQGKGDHLSGHEQSRLALEHSAAAHQKSREMVSGHGATGFSREDITTLANKLWLERGCPEGSPDQDWFDAVSQLQSRAVAR